MEETSPQTQEKIVPRVIEEEMRQSYVDYAMSVIVGRALPDVRDGLKPVHRRILFAMNELGLQSNKPFRKCARITGDVLGKYHPHGDTAVYDSLVRMAQDFSLRYPLVNGHGNFGCFTGDTKVKLTDGRGISFKELIKEFEQDKRNFTYTADREGSIKIAEIIHPRLTKKDQELVKITLDNDAEIKCTLDHKFMLRNGKYKEAQYLIPGDSLMPCSFRDSTEKDVAKPDLVDYRIIHQPNSNQWEFVHKLADNWNLENKVYTKNTGKVGHHIDFNKHNHNSINIQRIRAKHHWKIHAEHASELHKDPSYRKKIAEGRKTFWAKQENREKAASSLKKKWRDPSYKEKVLKGKILNFVNTLLKKYPELTQKFYEKERTNNCYPKVENAIEYFDNFEDMVEQAEVYNHKVIGVEFLKKREDVYDLTIEGTHNFALAAGVFVHNSIDGDNPAAMRYTEAKMEKLAEELLQDIDKKTVKFQDNFDGSLKEPTVLPAKAPNLLINGSSGIAVGMATSIPPHNLNETVDAAITLIDNPHTEVDELMKHVKGPDFPTGGIVCGSAGIRRALKTGRGKAIVRAKTEFDEAKNRIIVTEIPYAVNKSEMITQIADLVRDDKIRGISDIRDESDRKGMSIIFELKKDANPDVVLNLLFKHSRLQDTFGIGMVALVDNKPQLLNLKQLIHYFIEHRKNIVRKRTEFDLKKAEARAHILEGLLVALKNIDATIKLIKQSKAVEEAKQSLITNLKISEKQSLAILEMRLQRLTALEQDKIKLEHKELLERIEKLIAILDSPQKILDIIKIELRALKDQYGNERRSQIIEAELENFNVEDLIKKERMVITVTHQGYIKRQPLKTYKQQKRGGKGVIAAGTKDLDFIEDLFIANTHSYILFFTSKGRIHWLKVYGVPEGSRQAMGKSIVNLLQLQQDEKITAFVPVLEFKENEFLIMATKNGTIKKTELMAYSRPRKGGIIAITLEENDELIGVIKTDGNQQIILATKNGQAVRFKETDVRKTGRSAKGVKGAKLREQDAVIEMVVAADEKTLVTITKNGFGKRTKISEYRLINRGGVGVKNIICSERNGTVVAVRSLEEQDELMFMSKKGITIRTPAKGISIIGRATQGLRLMKLSEGDEVVAAAKIIQQDKTPKNGNKNNTPMDKEIQ